MEMTEERFNELENRLIEIIQSEQHRGKLLFLKNGGSLRDRSFVSVSAHYKYNGCPISFPFVVLI